MVLGGGAVSYERGTPVPEHHLDDCERDQVRPHLVQRFGSSVFFVFGFRVSGFGCWVSSFRLWVSSFGFHSLGFRVQGLVFGV